MKLVKPVIMITALSLSCSVLANETSTYDFEQAEQDRQERESMGIIGGIVAGAAVGGPAGAVIGGALGSLMGNKHHDSIENEALAASLKAREAQILAMQEQQAKLEEQYHAMLDQNQRASFLNTSYQDGNQLIEQCCTDSALAMHFRTNSSVIEPHYLQELENLAELSQETEGAVIEVLGYADRRGSTISNMALSRNRVNAVIRALVDMGVDVHSIQSSAFGEAQPLNDEENAEVNFFDRRVNVRVRTSDSELVTLSE